MLQQAMTGEDNRWQTLRLMNGIRIGLAGVLLALAILSLNGGSKGNGALLAAVACAFTVQAFFAARQLSKRAPNIDLQIRLHLSIDFVLLVLLVALGNGNFASLLFIPCVAGSLMLPNIKAYGFAALSSLTVLLLQIEHYWRTGGEGLDFVQSGMLGVVFFTIAVIGKMVSTRLIASETQREKTDINLANLEAASSLVIQNLDSGVVVIDGDNRIRLMNGAAIQMLGVKLPPHGRPVRYFAPGLHTQITQWRRDPRRQVPGFACNGRELVPRFVPVGQMGRSGLLAFLDDAEQLSSEAQQSKLASLGQLTASIAHEIRNPLSAINHAAQLLGESPSLDEADAHLADIIKEQVVRVDGVISNVLRLSRREKPHPVIIPLHSWLKQFRDCFILEHQLQSQEFVIEGRDVDAEIRMDESQLDQVLSNLCRNALHFSRQNNASSGLVTIRYGHDPEAACLCLDVIDQGPGVEQTAQENIFVPFFTTRHEGTGLGLYLARSLCETNGARLVLQQTGDSGSTFRIIFTTALH